MEDTQLERLALLTIIVGLILIMIMMPAYDAVDAHYLQENDNKAFLEGTIQRNSYREESGWSALEIRTEKITTSFYEGKIDKKEGEKIYIKGSYHDETFTIKEYK